MESNWAADNLQVIRTLMERSAIYRRALAPIMIASGSIGLLAAVVTCFVKISSPAAFAGFWMVVGLLAVAASFLLVRRQALHSAEPFWSPPTRRVTQALLPGLMAGLALGVWVMLRGRAWPIWLLPPVWVALYGCALHAAGFFMPRGMKLFGWGFVATGSALFFWLSAAPAWQTAEAGHYVMGIHFGVLHLAYGAYLYVTESRKQAP